MQRKPHWNNNIHKLHRGEYWKSPSKGQPFVSPSSWRSSFPFPWRLPCMKECFSGQWQTQYSCFDQLSLQLWGQHMETGNFRNFAVNYTSIFLRILTICGTRCHFFLLGLLQMRYKLQSCGHLIYFSIFLLTTHSSRRVETYGWKLERDNLFFSTDLSIVSGRHSIANPLLMPYS